MLRSPMDEYMINTAAYRKKRRIEIRQQISFLSLFSPPLVFTPRQKIQPDSPLTKYEQHMIYIYMYFLFFHLKSQTPRLVSYVMLAFSD